MSRFVTSVLFVVFALFMSISNVRAGGWATVVFDALPAEIHAGEPTTVRFLVRQHGITPVHSAFGETLIAVLHVSDNEGNVQDVKTEADEEVGFYHAELILPTEGRYVMKVTTNLLDTGDVVPVPITALAPLVASEPLVAAAAAAAQPGITPMTVVTLFGIALLLGMGAVLIARTR